MGIRLGVLAGLAFALFKIVQSRRPAPAPSNGGDAWAGSPRRETESPQPELVRPTMLESVSVRDRPPASATPTPGTPASGTPASGTPASGTPASGTPAPQPAPAPHAQAPAPEPAAEPEPEPADLTTADLPVIEPDADEVVILSDADDTPVPDTAPLPVPPAEEALAAKAAAQEEVARPAPAKRAAKKGVAKKAAKKAAAKKAVKKAVPAVAWVDPEGGVCPGSHPIKAKLRSGIFHLPGMAAYDRTTPDRCYSDEAAAQGDGLRRAAR